MNPTNFEILLDTSQGFTTEKVALLDQLCQGLQSGDPSLIGAANTILTQLRLNSGIWQFFDIIIENSQFIPTKLFVLSTLENKIETRWKDFSETQKEALKKYIVSYVIKLGSNQTSDKLFHALVNKANSVLVKIAKNELSSGWMTFIPEIVNSSKTNPNLCENNLNLLKYLSEEIFDDPKSKLTRMQILELKAILINEFGMIYELCYSILKSYFDTGSVKGTLVAACLKTLQAFLNWIPLGYIFLTDLLEILLKFIDTATYRSLSIRCLAEVASISITDIPIDEAAKIKQKAFQMFTSFLVKLNGIIPPEISFTNERTKLFELGGNHLPMFDNLCEILTLFFTGFFKSHLGWIEPLADNPQNPEQSMTLEVVKKGFDYLVNLTSLPHQCWKNCSEFWLDFTNEVVKKMFNSGLPMSNQFSLIINQPSLNSNQNSTIRIKIYNPAFAQVSKIVITRMVKPPEVLITIDENGIPVKNYHGDSEDASMHEILSQLFVNLTKLDGNNTKAIIESCLERQVDGTEWSFNNLNQICWAAGSISSVFPQQEESTFLLSVLRALLNLIEIRGGKESRAVISSNIMYIFGQYSQALRLNWNLLKTAISKLFEFMNEKYPGVAEMACQTFLKITQVCKQEFVIIQPKPVSQTYENEPIINELLKNFPTLIQPLEKSECLVIYQAMGEIISAEPDVKQKIFLLENLLSENWVKWGTIMKEASLIPDVLKDEKFVELISYIVEVHERVAFGVGHYFYECLAKIYLDMIKLYIYYSGIISQEAKTHGKKILNWMIMKKMRRLRKSIIKLIITYINKSEDPQLVVQNFVSPALEILKDYSNNIPEAREADVHLLFSVIIKKLSFALAASIPQILEFMISVTLQIVTQEFEEFKDHWINFFDFLQSVINNCFTALFNIPAEQFRSVMDCIIWSSKHEVSKVSLMGLDNLAALLQKVNIDADVANKFYAVYYVQILKVTLSILTDGIHKEGFKQEAQILSLLLGSIDKGLIAAPLYDKTQNLIGGNKEFLYNYITELLSNTFPVVSKQQTGAYVANFFQAYGNIQNFKIALAEYLINLPDFTNDMESLEMNAPMPNDKTKESTA